VKKMRLYNGEEVDGLGPAEAAELKAEAGTEGMSGVDPRRVLDFLGEALVAREGSCLGPLAVLRVLKEGLGRHPGFSAEERERFLRMLALARQEYDRVVLEDLRRILAGAYREEAQRLFERYLENVRAYFGGAGAADPLTANPPAPDEELMAGLEEELGVDRAARRAFREEVFWCLASSGKEVPDYRSHPALRQAVERRFLVGLKDVFGPGGPMEERLAEDQGYCPACARELVEYAAALLSGQPGGDGDQC
jgi:serine protein kinase